MKIAVIGSGISGLGAAYILSKKYEVHLFEAADRLGGHAHTVKVQGPAADFPVDTGFLVYNELTYPHLTAMFKHLNVATNDSDMSLSIRLDHKKIEWAGQNLNSVFGQRRNLLRPSFHRMLLEVLRFHREVENNLNLARRHAWTLGEMLDERKYSQDFCQDYLLPMSAAIWSTPEQEMRNFPAATFLTFMINHKLVQVNDRPIWRTVTGGSIEYVQKIASHLKNIQLSTAVQSVTRRPGHVLVKTKDAELQFDRVVFATHAPVTAKILRLEGDDEREILTAFRTEPNLAVLHGDAHQMPAQKRCWASWNSSGSGPKSGESVALTYYLNRLQQLPTPKDLFLTLNPKTKVERIQREIMYEHPQFDQKAIRAQRRLPDIQGRGGVYYAGAWTRYGFHEDGLLSAVRVAEMLGCEIPWSAA